VVPTTELEREPSQYAEVGRLGRQADGNGDADLEVPRVLVVQPRREKQPLLSIVLASVQLQSKASASCRHDGTGSVRPLSR
jgi:hypothetical protein